MLFLLIVAVVFLAVFVVLLSLVLAGGFVRSIRSTGIPSISELWVMESGQ